MIRQSCRGSAAHEGGGGAPPPLAHRARRSRIREAGKLLPTRAAAALALCVLVVVALGVAPAASAHEATPVFPDAARQAAEPGASAKRRCRMVKKRIRGRVRRVRVCTRTRRRPAPPPPPAAPPRAGDRIAATVPLGFSPMGVAHEAGAVWAASTFPAAAPQVARVDPATNSVTTTTPLPVAGFTWVAGAPGSVWVTVAEGGPDPRAGDRLLVVRIDPATNAVVSTLAVGRAPGVPAPLAIGEGAVWVTNFAESTVTRISLETNAVVAVIPTTPEPGRGDRGHPSGVAVAGGSVWVVNHRESSLVRIDVATNAVVGSTAALDGRLAAGGGALWVASAGSDEVARVDPTTGAVVATIRGCAGTGAVAVGAGSVWVTGSEGLCRIDPALDRVVTVSALPYTAFGVTFADGAAWVASEPARALFRVEPAP